MRVKDRTLKGLSQGCTLSYMSTFTMSAARARMAELLDRVERGEEVEITRHGRSIARLVGPRSARTSRTDHVFAAAEQLRSELDAARHQPLGPPVSDLDIQTRIRALRADRRSR